MRPREAAAILRICSSGEVLDGTCLHPGGGVKYAARCGDPG